MLGITIFVEKNEDPKDKDQDDSIIQIILVLFFATWYEFVFKHKAS